jgi:citronellol/citronellal dehydrogenase
VGKLTGKTAIVTGASRGIGQQIAELFAAEGAKVVCAARTLNEGEHRMLEGSLSRTVELIRGKGGEATAVTADVSHEAECVALVEAARAAYGPIDILVNNAALNYYLPTETYPTNRWVRCFAINVHAPFILAKAVLTDMIPRRSGAIVNISSGAAIGPGRGPYDDKAVRGGVMYGATKAALERFTQGLAQEVAQYEGITVAAVSPSQVVPTPGTIYHKLVSGPGDPRSEPPIMMARAVLLLASEPPLTVNGRVTYSQQILKEFGWIDEAKGRGVTIRGSGYSLV